MDINKVWSRIGMLVFLFIVGVWPIYTEIDLHYLETYNGIVIEKQESPPPKKMPELVIKGAKRTFPCWKWAGIDFDSVKLGDSIVKKKYNSFAYYYKKTSAGKYVKIKLKYWTRTF
ncbi:hypothetical protein LX99_03913 [Mucilaginibacter oryzae]|uniref:Uncharacterized protein n=1 Tax=Mucilaginibacter oryzae TaxID=468058 RepID=A0A316H2Y4_9SPHI|nr:hypothetical protein [Mucilaginibacter oryzae]PWK75419.1 hypothetical protein LX99_03913 [Mucilaginibacter oryzae]